MKIKVEVCPGTLKQGYSTYSPVCIKKLFAGNKVSHILQYNDTERDEEVAEKFIENRKRISISGVQEKLSLLIEDNVLRLTNSEEQGSYILKPIPRDLKKVDEVPANEHLTMQIAKQVFGIEVAENGLIFFKNGSPAYITRRFDVKSDGTKKGIEDFASLAGKSVDGGGSNFKYDYSYEEIGELIQKFIPAWRIEIEKFYSQVVFNYLFSNGDAHLKNFSIIETSIGDYKMSPAYDLINTHIHVDDSDFALSKGLFKDDFKSEVHKVFGHPNEEDFTEFGKRLGISSSRIKKLLEPYLTINTDVEALVMNSFLSAGSKRGYLLSYKTKRNYLTNMQK
jgi:serine/threonine-protein kinase HipA